MEIFGHMLQALIDPQLVIYLAVGVFLGIYIGAVPGLSVTMAASLLISFTYSWDVLPSMAAMVGIYIGGVYGGSRSAILLNIPPPWPPRWTAIPWPKRAWQARPSALQWSSPSWAA